MSFDPRSLIANLPPFDPSCDKEHGADADDYNRFCQLYQLQFDGLTAQQHLGQLDIDGQTIAIHLFRPVQPQGTLLIVHGYLDHHGLYHHLIRYALKHQLNVVAFDLPGHGLSSGKRAAIDNFAQYQTLLSTLMGLLDQWQLTRPLHLLGQSTGAAIINHYLLSQKPDIDGEILLLAPLVRAARWPLVSLAHRLLSPWKTSVKRDFPPNSHDPAFNHFLPNDPLQSPVISTDWIGAMKRWLPQFLALPPSSDYRPLLIQGQQDATVDWRYNLRILKQKYPALQALLIAQARHQLANEAEPIRSHYLDWLDQRAFRRTIPLPNPDASATTISATTEPS